MSFDFINNSESRLMLEDTHTSITKLALWSWLKDYTLSNQRGCIFNNHPNFKVIENNQDNTFVYTGQSWNWIMNIMTYIAVNDIKKFKEFYLKKQNM